MAARVAELWRYPVKSMLGERMQACEIGPAGIVGDRAYALIDREDGMVASAKQPHKWRALLGCRAALVGDAVVEITLPDGSSVRSDDADVDDVLSRVIGRDVHLASTAAAADRSFEEVWPDIEGLAPPAVISGTSVGTDEDGQSISKFPLGGMAPPGTFFDLALLHLMTTATIAHLRRLAPAATFDVRRYRPNVLIDTDDEGFVENGWAGRALRLGITVEASVTIPTMRCVMTTLAQEDLPQDRETLRAIAANNRVEITGWGTWACAGVYADVATGGEVRVGDEVELA